MQALRGIQKRIDIMFLAADVLLLLSSFSIRTQFIVKAVQYGRAGVVLFPDDLRLREIYAYALCLDGSFDEAAEIIGPVTQSTPNVEFLKLRLAFHGDRAANERSAAIRSYLKLEWKT